MADRDIENLARLMRQVFRLMIQQELEEMGVKAPAAPKPSKKSEGKVVRAKSPQEVQRDREKRLDRALGLDRLGPTGG